MFIRTKPVANSSRKRVQICASQRVGDKVKQKVIKHVGIAQGVFAKKIRRIIDFCKNSAFH